MEKTYEPLPGFVFVQAETGGAYHLGEVYRMDGDIITYNSLCHDVPNAFVPTDVKTMHEKTPGKDICQKCAKERKWLIEL